LTKITFSTACWCRVSKVRRFAQRVSCGEDFSRKGAKSQGRKVAEAKAQSRKVAKGERKPLRNAAALCAFALFREKISSLENHMLPQDESR
jgi:hypothetical protein